ncbi:serine hydrolase-like protein [Dermacentor andersoni]|uniref:serine hydrolase-like protein n=1 Tax=Dermacentor andersoni TaxID=34620 RepID=UPI0021559CE6|nr:serine hydrolase-like protein [Dermacentor andersoni]
MERRRSLKSKDLLIPVGYGYLHAKDSGPSDGLPVLAIHDWLDNCASFDTLVPLLDPAFRVIALDLVGHGASSNLPRGYQYSHQQFVEDIDCVLDYLGWSYCAILAHGVGATMALYYAGLRPDVCTGVVSLSMSDTVNTHPGHMLPTLVQHIDASGNLDYQKAGEETIETVVRDLVDVTGGSLDEESARVLLGAEEEAGQTLQLAVLSRCLKVYTLSEMKKDPLTIQNTMTLYQGPLLMVCAKDWCDDDEDGMLRICEDFFRTSCDPFVKLDVDGTHHVHLNNPALVASHVSDFLRKSCLSDLSCPSLVYEGSLERNCVDITPLLTDFVL